MSTIKKPVSINVEEYLQGEEHSDARHEYEAGEVYAMVGGSSAHNAITLNISTILHSHLRGTACRAFMSDMKIRVRDIFYYPDVLVTCEQWNRKAQYQTEPILVVEVLSETTEHKDRFDKRTAYQGLDSLKEYVLVAQDERKVEIFRRTREGWELETCTEGDEVRLTSVELNLPIALIYEDV